jgi:hypothetical protein
MTEPRQKSSSPDTELPFLRPLEPPTFPSFPTLKEMAEERERAQKREETGLFDGLLGGNVGALYEDWIRHPDKYERRTSELLTQLASGSRSLKELTPEERRLLDSAVVAYAQAPALRRAPRRALSQPKQARKRTKRVEPVPGRDVPITEMPPYWWVR